jgi:hypothetical protein
MRIAVTRLSHFDENTILFGFGVERVGSVGNDSPNCAHNRTRR